MLNYIRKQLAILLLTKAYDLLATGDFRKILKAISYWKYGLVILPKCEVKDAIAEKIIGISEKVCNNPLREGLV